MINRRWAINLPYKLKEALICDLIGHKPALDLELIPNLTVCDRCMAPLKKTSQGLWTGNLAILDIKPQIVVDGESRE
jgi:hypothetical protein